MCLLLSKEDICIYYYNVLGAKNCGRFSAKDAPTRIWAGKPAILHTQSIELEYEKISLVFDGGKLCGVALNQKRSLSHQLPIRDGKLILKK